METRRPEGDLVMHEAGLGVHTPLHLLEALPSGVRARMRLAHFPDGLDVSHSSIEPLGEGRLYSV